MSPQSRNRLPCHLPSARGRPGNAGIARDRVQQRFELPERRGTQFVGDDTEQVCLKRQLVHDGDAVAHADEGPVYYNEFEGQPASRVFRPERVTPRPRVEVAVPACTTSAAAFSRSSWPRWRRALA